MGLPRLVPRVLMLWTDRSVGLADSLQAWSLFWAKSFHGPTVSKPSYYCRRGAG